MYEAKIMIVEDEADVLLVNRQYFIEQGYDVYCAANLQEARLILAETPPDIIILDIMLPDGSGRDFCREIRKTSTAPIIYLSCLGDDMDIVEGLTDGGDDYIVKPHSLEVLGARVAVQLRRRGIGVRHIELPPLYLDLTSGTARLDKEEIPLSKKEFQLLLYFVENRGRYLTQQQIYEAVWGGPPETMGNTIKMNVSRLRQKLKLDNGSCFELSHATGQGYIFIRIRYPER